MENIENAPFLREMVDTASNLYRLGWDERNGGNISYLLSEAEVADYLDVNHVLRRIPMDFDGSALAGKYFLVTGSGKYFKNVAKAPAENLGLIRIAAAGDGVEILWGYSDGGVPTSELPSHLMSHIARLSVNPKNRVVMHCHATHLLAMTFTHDLDERAFTRTLWQMCTECLVVFPDGVGVVPWLIPGTNEIGMATSDKMKETRLVVWPHHGIYGAGETMDETFGLIETAEKAAQVYTIVCAQGPIRQTISDRQLAELGESFGVEPKAGYLDLVRED
ncbi:rhamnulose-1-phosphate aldolase [Listeria floridensis FSL S10-1187]|uniref:Rhamnulose-1-phosphate aldolase n=1 Tax=Listeria floridensis FSL S10-1187 TaxID=1265817 RepID=A0ABN0RJ19_9LIST|nr:rhamnulose-1-phosphate aldolase [Listeria floridensis]EUJ33960.1 rhamnulose-1-phosphate aldolase [Listeria floridensis FSL S10-1187]